MFATWALVLKVGAQLVLFRNSGLSIRKISIGWATSMLTFLPFVAGGMVAWMLFIEQIGMNKLEGSIWEWGGALIVAILFSSQAEAGLLYQLNLSKSGISSRQLLAANALAVLGAFVRVVVWAIGHPGIA